MGCKTKASDRLNALPIAWIPAPNPTLPAAIIPPENASTATRLAPSVRARTLQQPGIALTIIGRKHDNNVAAPWRIADV
jgi:hypothetical protein